VFCRLRYRCTAHAARRFESIEKDLKLSVGSFVHGAELSRFTKNVLDADAASGYALLRRIPSTRTWKVLDYVSTLERAERDAFFNAFVSNGLFLLYPDRDPSLHAYQSGDPAYRRFIDAMPQLFDWKYADVRLLRGILGDLRSKAPSPEFANVPAHVIQRAEAIQPTNAAAIRREVKSVLTKRFGAKAENRGGGNWLYPGGYAGRPFQVRIDYGGRSDQLRYELFFDDVSTGIRARRLSYEGLIGLGDGHWDFVTADNLSESVVLLADLIQELVVIPQKVPSTG